METQVRTPQTVFMQPQRLIVPLFQRPYVWNQENQWEPLWNDVARLADRLLSSPHTKQAPHFLGAVVLQQVQNPAGTMQERTIIDGQQRLTTLQLLFDALHAELVGCDASAPALRLESLVVNAEPFCRRYEDKFKVWPTNRDRPAFNAVMGATPPVDYASIGHRKERMVEAHRYFSERAREWLRLDGADHHMARANAIETVVRDLLQMVVIDLAADENAQEIFETLNARGAQLTAADLIKNFTFQLLLEAGADVESHYETYWKDFETAFWESEISVGRLLFSRSSVFLYHWLIAKTGEEIVAREVFTRFKRYAHESGKPMVALLPEIHRAAKVYRTFIEDGAKQYGPIERVGLFSYRTSVLESEVVKPLILALFDPEEPHVPEEQLREALNRVESWMVRRMIVRATTKGYNRVIAELIKHLQKWNRAEVGDSIETYLKSQSGESQYWPDDQEVIDEIKSLQAYKRLRRARLRMILEAIEDHKRGWREDKPHLIEERIPRGKFAIEHVLPRKWATHWPLDEPALETERDSLLHTLGNLTLLTAGLNSKVSNGPWIGENSKRNGLEGHDVLFLNRELIRGAETEWTHTNIRSRSDELSKAIIEIWPAPPGHRSGFAREKLQPSHSVDLVDLISADLIQAGATLYCRRQKFSDCVATLLPDGRIDFNGTILSTPSEAAKAITNQPTNGWSFFLVDKQERRALKDVRRIYIESITADAEDLDPDDDSDPED